MAEIQKQAPVTIQELLVTTRAQTDPLAQLLIEKELSLLKPGVRATGSHVGITYG